MNKRTLLVLPISLTLFACTSVDPLSGLNCSELTGPEPSCAKTPSTGVVTIHTNNWNVTPRCYTVSRAAETKLIKFNLAPAASNPLGSTAIVPKNLNNTWLTGSNSPDSKEIVITVPDWVENGEYSYGVIKSTGDCLDPRVNIVD